jgi:hypothetical protein
MRWVLSTLLGAALTAVGIAELAHELVHGSDIWRRHGLGIGLAILGACILWNGLSERANGRATGRPIWPAAILLIAIVAIAAGLYVLSPVAAVLFAIILAPFGMAANVTTRWFGDDG